MVNVRYRCRHCNKDFVGDTYENELGIKMFNENNFPAQRKHLCNGMTSGYRIFGISDYVGIETNYDGEINV